MSDSATILVIILSSFLAIFILLAIIATYKFIQVLEHLKHISEKAEKIADSAEHVGEFFRHTAGPVAIAKLLANLTETVFNRSKRKTKGSSNE